MISIFNNCIYISLWNNKTAHSCKYIRHVKVIEDTPAYQRCDTMLYKTQLVICQSKEPKARVCRPTCLSLPIVPQYGDECITALPLHEAHTAYSSDTFN